MSRKPITIDESEIEYHQTSQEELARKNETAQAQASTLTELKPAVDPSLQHYFANKVKLEGVGGVRRRRGGLMAASSNTHSKKEDEEEKKKEGADKFYKAEGPGSSAHRVLVGASEEVAQALISTASPLTFAERRMQFEQTAHILCMEATVSSRAAMRGLKRDGKLPAVGTASNSSQNDAPVPTAAAAAKDSSAFFMPSLSLLESFFEHGVPDVEPWDRWVLTSPYYDPQALILNPPRMTSSSGVILTQRLRDEIKKAGLDRDHVPALPEPYVLAHYPNGEQVSSHRQPPPPPKSKEERRAERREKMRLKQQAEQARRNAGEKIEDRLHHRNLLVNLWSDSVLNPMGTETKIVSQYQQRIEEHERRNFERHIAALPDQQAKRECIAKRHAEERPLLRCYRIYPIFSPQHLGKLRNFANDQRLRGFITWTCEIEAVVVLAGGEVALRHLDHWILSKMEWEHPDTQATRVCSITLNSYAEFSFHLTSKHLKTASSDVSRFADKFSVEEESKEAVFLVFFPTLVEALQFFSSRQPASRAGRVGASHSSPWSSLLGLWKPACLKPALEFDCAVTSHKQI